jgi:hypothetical protein
MLLAVGITPMSDAERMFTKYTMSSVNAVVQELQPCILFFPLSPAKTQVFSFLLRWSFFCTVLSLLLSLLIMKMASIW